MFEISKYKKSIVSCIHNSLDEMDLNKYKNIEISEPKEVKI